MKHAMHIAAITLIGAAAAFPAAAQSVKVASAGGIAGETVRRIAR